MELIFSLYLSGNGARRIAVIFNDEGIPSPTGKKWNNMTILKILKQEKYIGDIRWQKTWSVFMGESWKINRGNADSFYIRGTHPAIINRDDYMAVQALITQSTYKPDKNNHTDYALTELLYCSHCGKPFRRTIWKIGDGKKGVWRCADRLESAKITCKKSPSLHEDKLHRAILAVINSMIDNTDKLNEAVQSSMEQSQNILRDIDEKIVNLSGRIAEINATRDTLLGNISGGQFEILSAKLKELNEEENKNRDELDALKLKKESIQRSTQQTAAARELFGNMQPLCSFDDMTVRKLIERITVISKTEITIRFRGGLEVSGEVEK